jgi:hypothetical protein
MLAGSSPALRVPKVTAVVHPKGKGRQQPSRSPERNEGSSPAGGIRFMRLLRSFLWIPLDSSERKAVTGKTVAHTAEPLQKTLEKTAH